MDALASCLTPAPIELGAMTEHERQRGLGLFVQPRSAVGAPMTAARTGSVYVSYPGEDTQAVAPVVQRLIDRFGDAIWWDQVRVLPGDDWRANIRRAFDTADVVLSCFGPGWITSPGRKGTFREEAARAADNPDRRVVPVLIGGLTVSNWRSGLSEAGLDHLANRHPPRSARRRSTRTSEG